MAFIIKKQKPENVETTSKKGGGKLSGKTFGKERNGAIARRFFLEMKEKQKDFSDEVSVPLLTKGIRKD